MLISVHAQFAISTSPQLSSADFTASVICTFEIVILPSERLFLNVKPTRENNYSTEKFDLDAFLQKHDIKVTKIERS